MNVGERPTQVTLRIKPEHIAQAIARDSNRCAVADAIKDAYPQFSHISVDIATIRVTDKKRGLRSMYFTPPRVQKFIIDFDQGKKTDLKPFVTRLISGQVVPVAPKTPTEKKKLKKAYQENKAHQLGLQKKNRKVRKMLKTNGDPNRVPVVQGGKLPPVGKGKFRTFGLRTLMV